MSLEGLDLRDDLLELADLVEQVVSLPPVAREPGRTVPGSRVPPGAEELLEADEVDRAMAEVDSWAQFVHHVVVDEDGGAPAETTPARLRVAAEHAEYLAAHPDELLALAVVDEAGDHLRAVRRLARRGERRVRTGHACTRPGCRGHLVSPLGAGGDRRDDALVCDRCSTRVPYSVWSSWPRAKVQWITPDHAARLLGTSYVGVRLRASRGRWRRIGTGRSVRYLVDDVLGVEADEHRSTATGTGGRA